MKRIPIGNENSSKADLNEIYKKTFEKEIKKTVENKGYIVSECNVDGEFEEEDKTGISKITIILESKKDSDENGNQINNIENIKINVGNETENTDDTKKENNITQTDIKELKEYLSDYYELDKEVFDKLGRNVTPFGASDCLNFISLQMFKLGDVTLIDRGDKKNSLDGLMTFTEKIIEGEDGIIFSEGTWNLHPIKPMQNLKIGGTQSAVIAKKMIVPTIFEYVEVPDLVKKESELYSRCIVQFGKPIVVDINDNLIEKTRLVQSTLEEMRINLWKKLGIKKDSLDDVDKDVYLNHTYTKKFKALGFEFDSDHEFQYLLKDKDGTFENEYTIDENGEFVPGVTHKK